MSYCRWSSDAFSCDVYAYGSDDGYVVHLAGTRHEGRCPEVDWTGLMDGTVTTRAIGNQLEAQRAFLATSERTPIDLPQAGGSFHLPDLDAFEAKLIEVRAIGYRFPDDVFEQIADDRDTEREEDAGEIR